MCLIITVEVPSAARETLERAARAASTDKLRVNMDHMPRWPWAQRDVARASISEDGMCACSLLTDEADWNAESWAMRPEVLEPLARTLETLVSQGPARLAVQTLWAGDGPATERPVTAHDLAATAREGRLGTRIRYVIERAAQQGVQRTRPRFAWSLAADPGVGQTCWGRA